MFSLVVLYLVDLMNLFMLDFLEGFVFDFDIRLFILVIEILLVIFVDMKFKLEKFLEWCYFVRSCFRDII